MHGGDIYRNNIQYDFSVNLNPLGTPKEVSRALSEAVLLANQYPDLKQEELSKHMADLFQIEKEEIVFGNGASELLMAFCHAFLPKKVMVLSPCFSGYEYAVKGASFDCQMVYHPLLEEDGFVLKEDILEHLTEEKPDMFFVTTPNNPTGVLVEKGLLKKIMEICEAQGTVVVLDECFLPLSGFEKEDSFVYGKRAYQHLIVLRAFTKTFAIPGARLGYAICQKDMAKRIRTHLPEWNISVFAQSAGLECLKHLDEIDDAVSLLKEERTYLTKELQRLGYRVFPSDANYILFYSKDKELQDKLLQQKILIRDCQDFIGLEKGFYRVAVKDHGANEKLVSALHQIGTVKRFGNPRQDE